MQKVIDCNKNYYDTMYIFSFEEEAQYNLLYKQSNFDPHQQKKDKIEENLLAQNCKRIRSVFPKSESIKITLDIRLPNQPNLIESMKKYFVNSMKMIQISWLLRLFAPVQEITTIMQIIFTKSHNTTTLSCDQEAILDMFTNSKHQVVTHIISDENSIKIQPPNLQIQKFVLFLMKVFFRNKPSIPKLHIVNQVNIVVLLNTHNYDTKHTFLPTSHNNAAFFPNIYPCDQNNEKLYPTPHFIDIYQSYFFIHMEPFETQNQKALVQEFQFKPKEQLENIMIYNYPNYCTNLLLLPQSFYPGIKFHGIFNQKEIKFDAHHLRMYNLSLLANAFPMCMTELLIKAICNDNVETQKTNLYFFLQTLSEQVDIFKIVFKNFTKILENKEKYRRALYPQYDNDRPLRKIVYQANETICKELKDIVTQNTEQLFCPNQQENIGPKGNQFSALCFSFKDITKRYLTDPMDVITALGGFDKIIKSLSINSAGFNKEILIQIIASDQLIIKPNKQNSNILSSISANGAKIAQCLSEYNPDTQQVTQLFKNFVSILINGDNSGEVIDEHLYNNKYIQPTLNLSAYHKKYIIHFTTENPRGKHLFIRCEPRDPKSTNFTQTSKDENNLNFILTQHAKKIYLQKIVLISMMLTENGNYDFINDTITEIPVLKNDINIIKKMILKKKLKICVTLSSIDNCFNSLLSMELKAPLFGQIGAFIHYHYLFPRNRSLNANKDYAAPFVLPPPQTDHKKIIINEFEGCNFSAKLMTCMHTRGNTKDLRFENFMDNNNEEHTKSLFLKTKFKYDFSCVNAEKGMKSIINPQLSHLASIADAVQDENGMRSNAKYTSHLLQNKLDVVKTATYMQLSAEQQSSPLFNTNSYLVLSTWDDQKKANFLQDYIKEIILLKNVQLSDPRYQKYINEDIIAKHETFMTKLVENLPNGPLNSNNNHDKLNKLREGLSIFVLLKYSDLTEEMINKFIDIFGLDSYFDKQPPQINPQNTDLEEMQVIFRFMSYVLPFVYYVLAQYERLYSIMHIPIYSMSKITSNYLLIGVTLACTYVNSDNYSSTLSSHVLQNTQQLLFRYVSQYQPGLFDVAVNSLLYSVWGMGTLTQKSFYCPTPSYMYPDNKHSGLQIINKLKKEEIDMTERVWDVENKQRLLPELPNNKILSRSLLGTIVTATVFFLVSNGFTKKTEKKNKPPRKNLYDFNVK